MGWIRRLTGRARGPVDLVTVHHEGAGEPSDSVNRFKHGGYTYGIGVSRWVRFRSVWESFATLGFNHVSLDLCLSGNRMDAQVTDADIALIRGAYLDCYKRKEVTAAPLVRAHKDSPGSSTVCPGDKTIARWDDIVDACRYSPPVEPLPEEDDMPQQVIEASNTKAAANEQPYGWLDTKARKVWSYWGFKIAWDGGDGDSVLHGDHDPKWIGIPGSAPIIGWNELSSANNGQTRRVRAYGAQGAEYSGTAHG